MQRLGVPVLAGAIAILSACAPARAVDCTDEAHLLQGDGPLPNQTLEELAGRLDGLLENRERTTFAGSWIAHRPRFHVKVLFATKPAVGRSTVAPYLDGADLRKLGDLVIVCETRHPLRRLKRDVQWIIETAPDVPYELSTNVFRNRVEVYVDSEAAHDAFIDHGVPETAVLIRVPGLSQPD